jgi:mono/diheme cytochrome c family protein
VAVAEAALMLAVLGLAFVTGAAGWVIGHYTAESNVKTVTVGSAPAPTTAPAGNVGAGKQVFASASCGGCHTLAASGSRGTVGPNLDQRKPARALVVARVTNGFRAMPSFKGQLTPQQIQDVADYVVASTR